MMARGRSSSEGSWSWGGHSSDKGSEIGTVVARGATMDRSLSDNFTSKWYDATRGNSVAANVIGVDASFTKEAR